MRRLMGMRVWQGRSEIRSLELAVGCRGRIRDSVKQLRRYIFITSLTCFAEEE